MTHRNDRYYQKDDGSGNGDAGEAKEKTDFFPRRCTDGGSNGRSNTVCLVSLVNWVDYKDADEEGDGNGDGDGIFFGIADSRRLCKQALNDETADLAILPTKALAAMAAEIVAETAVRAQTT